MATNFEIALKAEMKRVIRCFHRYDVDARALLGSCQSHSRKAKDGGEFFYTHPALPDKAFPTRTSAARAAMVSP